MKRSQNNISLHIDAAPNVSTFFVQLAQHALLWLFQYHSADPVDLRFSIGFDSNSDVHLSSDFHGRFNSGDYGLSESFIDHPVFKNDAGENDYLSSIVYMINYLQEYSVAQYDSLGRFRYEDSYQNRFSCPGDNLVLTYFKALVADLSKDINLVEFSSRVFVSHDVDSMYRGLYQDGYNALKKGRLDLLLQLIWREAIGKPQWFNLDKVMDITSEYDIKSTFFWLVESKIAFVGKQKLHNADYKIDAAKVVAQRNRISDRGFEHGLHKSISNSTFKEEYDRLNLEIKSNRNHFLKFNVPNHFSALDRDHVEMDFSLGFAEQFGFRNSYGLPYRPVNLESQKVTNCLMVPLNVMETSNWTYLKLSLSDMQLEIEKFLLANRQGALLSILWHNNYFSELKFEGYLDVFKSTLNMCRELGISGITQKEIKSTFAG